MALSDRKAKVARPVVRSRGFELKGNEADLVRSTDVFSEGAAFGGGPRSAPVVDWDAMAEHARTAQGPLGWREFLTNDGRYYHISKPVLIALAMGLAGGIAVSMFAQYTDRIPYTAFSEKGSALMRQKDTRPAVEYFLSRSNQVEIDSWRGSPYHIAGLEALAEAYARDKCYMSADETFQRVIGLVRKNAFHDDVRLASLLEHYGDFLKGQKRDLEAGSCYDEARALQSHNRGSVWVCFFAILAFAFEGIYMTGVLLGGKGKLEYWHVYAGFAMLGALGMTTGFFIMGLPIVAALAVSVFTVYGAMPALLVMACAVGKRMPAFHVLLPSSKRK